MKGIALLRLILGGLLLCAAFVPAQARHIIGGEATYECLGNNNYRIRFKIYRDCLSGGAPYDDPAYFAFYRGTQTNSVPYVLNNGLNYLSVPLGIVTQINPDDNPCIVNVPNLCVEETEYVFTVNLPPSNLSYFITYQRCCRNETILNLVAPGDTGATYFLEITNSAQTFCNNSPVFDDFPPIVICSGFDIDFDHSASDADGDSLVYSFISPLDGGGLDGVNGGNPNGPNGVQPIPATAPPYDPVIFQAPAYNAQAPMAGDPLVNIDPQTGLITGAPTTVGQYVVAVRVEEYRFGVKIGEIRREFQFNVTNCQPTVLASIQSDEVINGNEYILTSCGENTISFLNTSQQAQFIQTYLWEFPLPDGSSLTNTLRDATITFPDTGTYTGLLLLNDGLVCNDEATITVTIYPGIDADFSFAYDTCVAGPVSFTDLSFSEGGPIVDWFWEFADGNISTANNPDHEYQIPGLFDVTLTVADDNGCEASTTQPLLYQPVPALVVVAPSVSFGCQPVEVTLNNLSVPIDDTYTIIWDLGDGNTSTAISPVHTYTEPGIFTVSVDITSPIGCTVSEIFPNLVTVDPSPVANFTYNPTQLSNFNPTINIEDLATGAIQWQYFFGDLATFNIPEPTYTFQDTGLVEIVQIVTHPSGCTDTFVQVVDIEPLVTFFMPNAFTPNADDINDGFRGQGIFDGMQNFELSIWNRWGEMVFQSNNPETAWNGRKNNNGRDAPTGVYVYTVRFRDPRGRPFELKGFATLIR